jgi:hypothetical protein
MSARPSKTRPSAAAACFSSPSEGALEVASFELSGHEWAAWFWFEGSFSFNVHRR